MALLEVNNVSKVFKLRSRDKRGSFAAVDGVSLKVEKGKCVGLVGESGCGKTTLARMILGIHKPTSGDIVFQDKSLRNINQNPELRKDLQMVYQDSADAVNYRLSIADVIGEPLDNFYHLKGAEREKKIKELLECVELNPDAMTKYPRQFSLGQLQRICIARALASDPKLIVMDEPLSSLDVSVQAQILNQLSDLKKKYELSYLLISHDLEAVYYLSDEIYVMYGGRIVESIQDMKDFDYLVHPYSLKLLSSCPAYRDKAEDMEVEEMTEKLVFGKGCPYAARCPRAQEHCFVEKPELKEISPGHEAACHLL